MTARAAALPALVLTAACITVWKVMQASVLAGWLTALAIAAVMAVPAMRLAAGGKGAHAAPRRYVIDLEEATIPRAPTEHEPPWEPAPAFQAAPVIEPDAVTHGPPPEPPLPDAHIVITATASGGQITSAHIAVLPPVQCPALPQWVTDILGADSVDGAMREICGVAHSFESNFSKGHARQVRELLAGES
jgi:hypothetical protein